MSGYSDKEYLKAAIKLKAINYIEKPLHPEEVQAAVLEAQTLYKQKLRSIVVKLTILRKSLPGWHSS